MLNSGSRSRTAMLAAVLMGLGASMSVPGMSQPTPTIRENTPRNKKLGLFNGLPSFDDSGTIAGRRGSGLTMASQKRASLKTKNRARNKQHHRKS